MSDTRPPEPKGDAVIHYRGWECGHDDEAALWGAEGWRAYKGGADLDAPTVSARTFASLLDEIDGEEEV